MAISNTPNNTALNLVSPATNGKNSSKNNEGNEGGLAGIKNPQNLKAEDSTDATQSKNIDDKKLSFSDLLSQQMQPTPVDTTPATDAEVSQTSDPALMNLALQQMGLPPTPPMPGGTSPLSSSSPTSPTSLIIQRGETEAAQAGKAPAAVDGKSVPTITATSLENSAIRNSTPPNTPTVTSAADKSFSNTLSQARQASAGLSVDPQPAHEIDNKPVPTVAIATTPLNLQVPEKVASHSVHLGSIQANIHSPQFANETAERVKFAISNTIQSAQIDLHPADLGPISITLQMQGQHSASINFSAAQPETRQALENALPRLRELLADAGIQLNDTHVGQQSFAQAQQQSSHSPQPIRTALTAEEATRTVTLPLNRQGDASGLLDLYA